MPYSKTKELPSGVKKSLPSDAQTIYKEAFNGAWDYYGDIDQDEREEISHRVAWSAVKKKYERSGSGNWHRK